jgi:hypothetical protein
MQPSILSRAKNEIARATQMGLIEGGNGTFFLLDSYPILVYILAIVQ